MVGVIVAEIRTWGFPDALRSEKATPSCLDERAGLNSDVML
jgi:hypothetical protein